MIELLAANWLWILLAAAFLWLHTRGGGCGHGDHGEHSRQDRPEASTRAPDHNH